MSDKTEGGDIDWAKLERETVAAAVKPFEVAKAKSDAEFGASLRAAQAELDRLLAARKTAEKQALEERCAMEKLPPVVRADIERGVTTAPVSPSPHLR